MKNIVILGAGGMGTLFGVRLIRGGHDDVYLINNHPGYVESVNARGILFRNSQGTQAVPAKAFPTAQALAKELDGPAGLVIVFVKGYANREAVESARCITGPDTYYLTLQNGLGNPESIAETGVVKPDRIFFGKTTEGGVMTEPGVIFHKAEGYRSETSIMPFAGGVTDTLLEVAKTLCDCGINTVVDQNIETAIWEKVMMNCVGNSMAALLRMSTKTMLEDEYGLPIAQMIAYEVSAVAQAKGLNITAQRADEIIERLSRNDLQASTGKDVLSMRRTEVDTLNGAVSRLGKKYGVPTPANDLLYYMISVLQNHYDKTWDLGHAPATCLH
ncbi:MAG: ketopantoate reductase family protein [Oscillospiraceae bacterium]|nr:ketopantoate reductase family protein [Oscillospiraceae bacterium]